MITVGDFLAKLISKGGGNPADEKYKIFFGNAELVKAEVPDEVATAIDNGLISIADAKNNHPILKNHYYTQALNGVDDKIKTLMEKWEAPEDIRNAVTAERNTYNRVPLLLEQMMEIERKKLTANKPDLAALNKEKEELHKQILTEKNRADAAEKDFESKYKDLRIQQKQRGMYTGLKTVYDNLDEDTRDITFNTLINKGLQDNNATFTLDDNNNLVLLKKDGTNYYGENNQQVNAKQFIEQIFSRNKLLVTNQPPPANGANGGVNNGSNNNGHNNAAPPQGGGGNNNGNTNTGSAAMKEILAGINQDLSTSNNVPIFGGGN